MTDTNATTIENAAEAIRALDREAMARGEDDVSIPEILRLLPRLAYELSADDLAAAFRRSAKMLADEADELERLVAQRRC